MNMLLNLVKNIFHYDHKSTVKYLRRQQLNALYDEMIEYKKYSVILQQKIDKIEELVYGG